MTAAEPSAPEPDDKDWTWVLDRPCPECGFDSAAIGRAELSPSALSAVATLRQALTRADATERPEPTVWSALEYGAHVRDVCLLFHTRLNLLLDEDDPMFANWDQDETALAERYWEQDPATVSTELDSAARADGRRHRPGRSRPVATSGAKVERLGIHRRHAVPLFPARPGAPRPRRARLTQLCCCGLGIAAPLPSQTLPLNPARAKFKLSRIGQSNALVPCPNRLFST